MSKSLAEAGTIHAAAQTLLCLVTSPRFKDMTVFDAVRELENNGCGIPRGLDAALAASSAQPTREELIAALRETDRAATRIWARLLSSGPVHRMNADTIRDILTEQQAMRSALLARCEVKREPLKLGLHTHPRCEGGAT